MLPAARFSESRDDSESDERLSRALVALRPLVHNPLLRSWYHPHGPSRGISSPHSSEVTCRDLVPHPTKYNRDLCRVSGQHDGVPDRLGRRLEADSRPCRTPVAAAPAGELARLPPAASDDGHAASRDDQARLPLPGRQQPRQVRDGLLLLARRLQVSREAVETPQ